MKITADTNVLIRTIVADDVAQAQEAVSLLSSAETVAISIQSLCELVWVLDRQYAAKRQDIAAAIRGLLQTANVVVDRASAEAGLAMLDAGGDFADGVIAHEGQWLGGEIFASFDRKAVRLLQAGGRPVRLLG